MDRRNLLLSTAALAVGGTAAMSGRGSAGVQDRLGRPADGSFLETTDGTRLFFRDWGSGAPLVFLHAWALDADMWNYQTAYFAERGWRCLSYDRRGHGRSEQPYDGYDADTLADDLAAVIEGHDLDNVTLIAHSMGGCEAVRYLSRHGSGRVARLILLAPTLPYVLKTETNPDGLDSTMIEAVREMWRDDFPKWVADNERPFVTAETSDAMVEWLRQMMLSCPLHIALECNRMLVETDFRDDCAGVDRPTLLIHGDRDVSAPLPLTGMRAADLIPRANLHVYEGAPHGLFVTHKERLNADIATFLSG